LSSRVKAPAKVIKGNISFTSRLLEVSKALPPRRLR
jgi:hypothetical protein